MLHRSDILMMVAKANCRPFDDSDYDTFAGVESDNPLIGEYKWGGLNWVIIIDNDTIQIMDENMTQSYNLMVGEPIQIF